MISRNTWVKRRCPGMNQGRIAILKVCRDNAMFTGPVTTLKILVCDRRVPALAGTWPTVATVLREMGHSVTVVADDP